MKKRKFAEGGYADSDDAKNLLAAEKREKKEYERSQMSDEPGATESLKTAAGRMGANPPMARTYTKKGPVITKEQMKKAGFDNLRDYMNAERGLKRRGDTTKPAASAPKAEPPKATTAPKTEPPKTTAPKAEPPKAEPAKTESSGARQGTFKRGLREFLGIDKEEPVKGVNVPSGATAVERMRKMKDEKYNKKSGGSVSYKSGGSVSASKRADGCAQRGKTRGKVL
jgi:hypothetical protein